MKASVIIPTYRRPAFLPDALASVSAQDFPTTDYEIIIVDNAPQPTPELEMLCDSSAQPRVRYVNEPCNGLHNARHAGARSANGEILVYIDDDVLCPPGWLAAMVAPYADDRVAMVAGKVILRYEVEPPPWLEQFSGLLSALDWGEAPHAVSPHGSPVGCNMSVRKSVLFDVGGFNPDGFGDRSLIYLRGDGENGLARKVHDAGWLVWYAPEACLEHRVPAKRMTLQYVCQRSRLGGIESAYRDLRYDKRSAARRLTRLARSVAASLYHRALAYMPRARTAQAAHHLAISSWNTAAAAQLARQMTSRSLRQHTLRQSYLDKAES